jgi:hypothetical protein
MLAFFDQAAFGVDLALWLREVSRGGHPVEPSTS